MNLITGTYEKAKAECQKQFGDNFFEFMFLYVDPKSEFLEINRFIYESKHTQRFVNRYEGNVVIDISEWNNKQFTNQYFDAFMFFVKDTLSFNNYTFIADKQVCNEIETKLSEFFEITIVELESIKPDSRKTIGFIANDEKECNYVRS